MADRGREWRRRSRMETVHREWHHLPTMAPPTVDSPADEAGAAGPTGDAAWPQPDAAPAVDPPLSTTRRPLFRPSMRCAAEMETASDTVDYAAVRRRKAARKQAEKGFGITAGRIAAALAFILVVLLFERDTIVRIIRKRCRSTACSDSTSTCAGYRSGNSRPHSKPRTDARAGRRRRHPQRHRRGPASAALRFALRSAAGPRSTPGPACPTAT